MKRFLGAFVICFLLTYGVLFVMALVELNSWAIIFVIALFLAIAVTIFLEQQETLEQLESRIARLEAERKETERKEAERKNAEGAVDLEEPAQ